MDSSSVMERTQCPPLPQLKILSWNINGIRTVKNLKGMLDDLDADIICLQETKVTRDMIDEPTALVEGYNAYFSFSRGRSGYSGVATYCRERATPTLAEEGLSGTSLVSKNQSDNVGCLGDVEIQFSPQELKRLDSEGRTVITQHKFKRNNGSDGLLTIFNVYCPRADPERPDRLDFKLHFNKLLETRVTAVKQSGSLVMVVGDINISHRQIDRCENVDEVEFEENPSRQWLNSFLIDILQGETSKTYTGEDATESKLIDSFRYFYPHRENAFTCWNTKINARATNYGSRIDYIFVDKILVQNMVDSLVLSEVEGSDHCPVMGIFNLEPVKSMKCPSACTKNFPEFTGIQQKLSSFFTKKSECQPDLELNHEQKKRKNVDCDSNTSDLKLGCISKKLKTQSSVTQKQISSFFQKASISETDKNDGDTETSGCQSMSSVKFTSEKEEDIHIENIAEKVDKSSLAASAWRNMLTGPRPLPLCKGHKEPCVERTVKKKGPNFNRKFYACARGEGSKTDPRARCDHFEWAAKK